VLSAQPRVKPQQFIIDGVRDPSGRIEARCAVLAKCEAERCRATTKLALRLLVLTAVRPGEFGRGRSAELEGLDDEAPVWRIPASNACTYCCPVVLQLVLETHA
jgi:hypothetical protein